MEDVRTEELVIDPEAFSVYEEKRQHGVPAYEVSSSRDVGILRDPQIRSEVYPTF